MGIELVVNLRNKKLGLLLRDARLAGHKSLNECAGIMGITPGILHACEEGRRAPTLPELEILAFYLNLPISHFWGKEALSDDVSPLASMDLKTLTGIRNRIIAASLRKQREDVGVSLRFLSEQTGISARRLKAFETGETGVPVSVLESLMISLDGRVESLFDHTSPIGKWMEEKKTIEEFLQLPPDLRIFVCKPVNRPYLKLALTLSDLSSEKLRSVAEGLLDITL
jgi:transcriptional regulator with XRE-family HTH domain